MFSQFQMANKILFETSQTSKQYFVWETSQTSKQDSTWSIFLAFLISLTLSKTLKLLKRGRKMWKLPFECNVYNRNRITLPFVCQIMKKGKMFIYFVEILPIRRLSLYITWEDFQFFLHSRTKLNIFSFQRIQHIKLL